MKVLRLNLKGEYFDQIKDGLKTEEYRLYKRYWKKRLINRKYNEVHILKGYPTKDDKSRRLIFPYRGYEIKTIVHNHFDNIPTKVFAIPLRED